MKTAERNGTMTDFRCPRCGTAQARTNGVEVYFGVQKVPGNPTKLAWICLNPECFFEVRWRRVATTNGNILHTSPR